MTNTVNATDLMNLDDDHAFCDADDCTHDENCFAVDPGADDRD